jgi:glycosyltransferase involved in cell wall biosynthesis
VKYFCVTPCLNAHQLINQTLLSVLGQRALGDRANSLHYVIVDGQSEDGTLEVINNTVAGFAGRANIRIDLISEPDQGMYDALAKGLARDNGCDIYCYLNAGDYFSPDAFGIAGEILANGKVDFLTGLNCRYNRHGHMIHVTLPFDYSRRLLSRGFYGQELDPIQQDSTFWSHRAHRAVDIDRLRTFRFAGDYFLWQSICEITPLFVVSAWLGGFCIHEGQLSATHADEYRREMDQIRRKRSPFDYLLAALHKLAWRSPNGVKAWMSRRLFRYDAVKDRYLLG